MTRAAAMIFVSKVLKRVSPGPQMMSSVYETNGDSQYRHTPGFSHRAAAKNFL
jgi:hypothetical protein